MNISEKAELNRKWYQIYPHINSIGEQSIPCVAEQARLTVGERVLLVELGRAWDNFVGLGCHAPDDLDEAKDAFHRIQQIIAGRVARRADPDVWGRP